MSGASINRVELLGNLGRDPELRYTSGGKAVTTLSIATDVWWRARGTGEVKKRTDWHQVTVWEDTAEQCVKYLRAGEKVFVVGQLQSRPYKAEKAEVAAEQGKGEPPVISIVADEVLFLGRGTPREPKRPGVEPSSDQSQTAASAPES